MQEVRPREGSERVLPCEGLQGRTGFDPSARACNLAAKRVWYEAHREEAIERASAWQRDNKDRYNARMRAYRSERTDRSRDEHLRRTFGLTLVEYEVRLERQGGVCAICFAPPVEKRPLHVDHDHQSGAIRGLICMRCNYALGLLRDRVDVVQRAAEYLEVRPADRIELEGIAWGRARALVGVG